MPVGRSRGLIATTVAGRLAIAMPDSPLVWRWWRSDLSDSPPPLDAMPQSNWAFDTHQLVVPMWFTVLLAGALAVALWIPWPTRLSRPRLPGNSLSSAN
jgi:hypothetical protein